jgi:hypothetical protein
MTSGAMMRHLPDHFWDFMEDGDLTKFSQREAAALTYEQIYRNMDGITALATAAATPLKRQKGERDTAFVKRIVATYMKLAHDAGVHRSLAANS